jgi:hypothetical protein
MVFRIPIQLPPSMTILTRTAPIAELADSPPSDGYPVWIVLDRPSGRGGQRVAHQVQSFTPVTQDGRDAIRVAFRDGHPQRDYPADELVELHTVDTAAS